MIPANGGFALTHTLFQAIGFNRLRAGFAPLAPGSAEGVQFASAQSILQTEFNRVKAHRIDNLVHMAFYRPKTLRNAIAAVGSTGGMIGIDNIGIKLNIGCLAIFTVAHVQRHRFVARITGHGQGVRPVSAGVAERIHGIGGNGAIVLDAGFHRNPHGVPRA